MTTPDAPQVTDPADLSPDELVDALLKLVTDFGQARHTAGRYLKDLVRHDPAMETGYRLYGEIRALATQLKERTK